MTATTNDQTHQELEAERDFLLRSLDDLEAERAAGSIDDESYRQLHADYTARAAAVIRALRDGIDTRPVRAPDSKSKRLVVIGAIVVFAVVAGVALAAALGARLPGQTSSGNSVSTETRQGNQSDTASRRRQLEDAVAQSPENVATRLLLAQELERDGDLAGALEQYDEVARIDPTSAPAAAHAGRILYLAAGNAPADQAADLVDRSRARLDQAIELDPEFADARYFRAIVLANEYQEFAQAQSDLQRYLVIAPNGQFSDGARQLLASVTGVLESPSTTMTPQP